MCAVKTNTTYVVEVETSAEGTTLYLYEKGQSRAQGYVDRRSSTGWGSASTLLHSSFNAGLGTSQTYVDNIREEPSAAAQRTTRYVYDAAGRQRYVVDGEGFVSENVFDKLGNVIETRRYAPSSRRLA